MDTARWERIEHVFHSVVDDPAGPDREARILELCGRDASLVEDVAALLAADDNLESFARPADRHLGTRLGSYQVDALAGRGGMASVYEAHRADDQFHQRVAIKIMDVRLSDDGLVAGFKAERQILAALEHSNITRLIDGGVTRFGEPYLVMEFIDGASIDSYCERERLDVTARVRLFARACAGVAFAHRNLVLHRDLKPSNILVTADGQPKVVDFGTATLLQPERLTTISRAPLTPSYASPEQLTGRPVGTASDQYSLGLILYELLCGTPAVPHGMSLIGAVERAIGATEPPSMASVVTTEAAAARRIPVARLRRQLDGDLGTIVRKATASDPAARYASVEHLIDDLYRWLRGDTIFGRPQSVRYRVTRFVARHRAAVATASLLVVSLVAATAWSLEQTRVARRESAKARELNRFMTTILSSANPSWFNPTTGNASSVTVRQAIDGAGDILATRPPSDPAVEAEVRRILGGTYTSLGALDQALPQLEASLALSTASGDAAGIATSETLIGTYFTARGDFKNGEAHHRRATAYYRTSSAKVDPERLAGTLGDLAAAIGYQRPGDPEAIALQREAIALADSVGSPMAPVSLHNLGVMLVRGGKLAEGEAAVRESLRRMDAMPRQLPERASTLRTLAALLFQQQKYAEAEPLAREAVEFAVKTRPPNHPLLPNNKAWWGRTLVATGQAEKGRAVLQEAYDGYRAIRPEGHVELALPLIGLGSAYRALDNLKESERSLRQAEAIIRKFPAQRDRIADMAGELGLTLLAMGRTDEGRQLLTESRDILKSAYGDAHPLTTLARERLAQLANR